MREKFLYRESYKPVSLLRCVDGSASKNSPTVFGGPGVYHPSVIQPPATMCTCVGGGALAFGAGPALGVVGGSLKKLGQSPPPPCGALPPFVKPRPM